VGVKRLRGDVREKIRCEKIRCKERLCCAVERWFMWREREAVESHRGGYDELDS